MKSIKQISAEKWSNLAKQKIYFGHQSVGYNIIDGIRSVMDEYPEVQLNIVEERDLASNDVGAFFHSTVGKNQDPASKTDDFVKIIESMGDNKADIAFHKYCYVDANADTDVEKIFSNYRERINYLKLKYPDTRFIHITMPLTTVQSGPKAWVKKIIGKPLNGFDANIQRNLFNKLLIENYADKDPVFDLAKAEATKPDGEMATLTKNDNKYLVLYKGYSKDAGHLNKLGQKAIAEQLLIFLAQLN